MTTRYPNSIWYPTAGKAGHNWSGHHTPLLILHDREVDNMGGHYPWPPHATIDPLGRWRPRQHIEFNRTAYALHHGPPNHRQHAYQIEMPGHARDVPHYPDTWYEGLAEIISWFHHALGVPLRFPKPFAGSEAYGEHGAVRMTWDEYNNSGGIIAHQHVPDNKHWDVGRLDVPRLEKYLGASHDHHEHHEQPHPAVKPEPHHDLTSHPEGVATVNVALPILKHVHPNTRNQHVKILQGLLLAAGERITLDSAFGPATESHVKHFQATHHQREDGVVGAATWRALL